MKLTYREDGTFRIVQLTDLHIGSLPHHEDDYKTFELLDKAFEKLDADLVMITGDLIWSEGVPNADLVFKELLERINQHAIPVAITYGNHDSEDAFTRSDLRKMEQILDYSVEKKNAFIVDDRESYTIEIYDAAGETINHVLYVMDSGAEAPLPIGKYEWVHPEQVNWFREISEQYKQKGRKQTDLMFMHIPLPEYWQASENILSGECKETNDMISAPYMNTGLFASVVMNGQVAGVFVGHDHDNNFVGEHVGVKLAYGQVSGYQCYGDFERGARLIQLTAEGMETRTIVESQI
ncbi:metallophosphoesterase family protein [Oceanobacillus polygoni]|uniref:3',5'-cyclic AMP phosphodiesterase CpdA n=1 Tax=Oceanobacillus polygoni TaxID=1235259 RepID=A0A9X0YWX2_9BACI|nr:metallophosphoesterase family protein [Oceanobacillus polygoni]MBP2079581.1 3',5'-cyclic AMP phosphodiesterase CpdA [Oceanobacillus polygoni]